MTDFMHLSGELAVEQISERVRLAERARLAGSVRPHGRHALAQHLHRLANRLDR